MDLLDLLLWFLKGSDWLALICACALGFLAGLFVPQGWWSIYTSILLSYHLFLAWLLVTAKDKVQTVRPLSYAIAIHAACLASLLILGMGTLLSRMPIQADPRVHGKRNSNGGCAPGEALARLKRQTAEAKRTEAAHPPTRSGPPHRIPD